MRFVAADVVLPSCLTLEAMIHEEIEICANEMTGKVGSRRLAPSVYKNKARVTLSSFLFNGKNNDDAARVGREGGIKRK